MSYFVNYRLSFRLNLPMVSIWSTAIFSAMESRSRLVEGESPEREGVDLFMF